VTVLLVVRTVMGVLDPSTNVSPPWYASPSPGGAALAASARIGNQKYSQATLFSDGTPSPGALWPASTRAEAGFILSTIDVGIRIVVPRSFVVS